MSNYSVITISKGEVKSIDGYIKLANAIGHNMKALTVSAYRFMNAENKDEVIEFKTRVMDELGYSNTTLSQMKFTGKMYVEFEEWFKDFPYTNTYEFRRLINKDRLEAIDEAHVKHVLIAVANYSKSSLGDDIDKCVEYLLTLSQKELRNVIMKYCDFLDGKVIEGETPKKEEPKKEEPVENDGAENEDVEEVYEDEEATFYNIIDDDMTKLFEVLTANGDDTYDTLIERMSKALDILGSYVK